MLSPTLTGLIVALLALGGASVVGLIRRSRQGRIEVTAIVAPPAEPGLLLGLGVEPGTPVTLLQFSSDSCAPCRVTSALCEELAATTTGVRHIEVEADKRLDAARALQIWRTPTLLIVDAQGRVVGRTVGVPERGQLASAIGEVIGHHGD